MLTNPEGQTTTIFFQLAFSCTNNIVEYEALLFGLATAKSLGMKRIKITEDSKLVIS